jgi:feruloyl esterase
VARGIAAFVLKYRVIETPADDAEMWKDVMTRLANPEPLIAALGETGRLAVADGMQAMKLARAHAKEWGVVESRIGFMGFSAGAMVASRVLLSSADTDRPDFVAPIYGAPFGEISPLPKQLPPVFMAYASDDALASSHVDAFYTALRKAGHHPELHVYDHGGHGFGMTRQGTSSDHWIEDFHHWLEAHDLTSPPTRESASGSCGRLKGLVLADTTIESSVTVAAGPFKDASVPWVAEAQLPEHCRLKGAIHPTPDSDIKFEVWMPVSNWNGKLHGAGNGGFAGSINYHGGLVEAVQRGYAGVSTDTGHTAGGEDASWAIGHPQKLVDFAHRAIHLMTVNAKAIVKAYYGDAPRHSYFSSCSNGGRQALMLAQRYPDDYDGIVAGAPANDWTGVMLDFVWNIQAVMKPGAFVPADRAPAIQAAVISQCDTLDGVADGVIGSPQACTFNPEKLLCTGAESSACLTAPQIAAMRALYEGMHSRDGAVSFPGFTPGAEVGSLPGSGWDGWIFGPKPGASTQARFGVGFMQGMVTGDARWQPGEFDFDHDAEPVIRKFGPILNATDPDLSRFAAHGGKLILFHGWADAAIPPASTIKYYESIKDKIGGTKRAEFVRLFMVPGMQHCFAGPGPSSFGGIAPAVQPSDPNTDLSAAVEQWVEKGIAPESVRAVKPKNVLAGLFDASRGGVERTGLLCAYPKQAKWNRTGNPNDAASYTCVNAE